MISYVLSPPRIPFRRREPSRLRGSGPLADFLGVQTDVTTALETGERDRCEDGGISITWREQNCCKFLRFYFNTIPLYLLMTCVHLANSNLHGRGGDLHLNSKIIS